jgi:hypothetical protein
VCKSVHSLPVGWAGLSGPGATLLQVEQKRVGDILRWVRAWVHECASLPMMREGDEAPRRDLAGEYPKVNSSRGKAMT